MDFNKYIPQYLKDALKGTMITPSLIDGESSINGIKRDFSNVLYVSAPIIYDGGSDYQNVYVKVLRKQPFTIEIMKALVKFTFIQKMQLTNYLISYTELGIKQPKEKSYEKINKALSTLFRYRLIYVSYKTDSLETDKNIPFYALSDYGQKFIFLFKSQLKIHDYLDLYIDSKLKKREPAIFERTWMMGDVYLAFRALDNYRGFKNYFPAAEFEFGSVNLFPSTGVFTLEIGEILYSFITYAILPDDNIKFFQDMRAKWGNYLNYISEDGKIDDATQYLKPKNLISRDNFCAFIVTTQKEAKRLSKVAESGAELIFIILEVIQEKGINQAIQLFSQGEFQALNVTVRKGIK